MSLKDLEVITAIIIALAALGLVIRIATA